jgi:hypothetical protein
MSKRGYVPSAWDLPWQERAEINQMYADMYTELSDEEKALVDKDNCVDAVHSDRRLQTKDRNI